MLRVFSSEIPTEVPIVGGELTPKLRLLLPDDTLSTADVPPSAPVDGHYLRYKWYRVEGNKNAPHCHVHPSEPATIQCEDCLRRKSLLVQSNHCSTKCYQDAWPFHRNAHEKVDKDDDFKGYNPYRSTFYPQKVYEVGHCRTYTPTTQDIGCVLKLEIAVISATDGKVVATLDTSSTFRVVASPTPITRRLISVSGVDVTGQSGSFTVLSYNILSDTSANSSLYSYCPPWARTWTYRRLNLLREIVGYGADVVCLQDVQEGHLEDFLAPELDKHGYDVHYKRRTNEVLSRNARMIDGCATFFKRDRFAFVQKYDVEFNKSAQAFVEAAVPGSQKPLANKQLIKDNIALIVVLQPKFGIQPADPSGKSQLICVANTRLDVQQDMKDVMLWHVHTLLRGMEKLAESSDDMPMIMCGDFNMVPWSAPYSLVVMGKIDPLHEDLKNDPFGILQPQTKLAHKLPMVSAYTAFSRLPMVPGLDKHRRSIHFTTNEPLLTICTKDVKACHDYIFYTAHALRVESLMELVDLMGLLKNTALPSTRWSSDHIALLAQFRILPKTTY